VFDKVGQDSENLGLEWDRFAVSAQDKGISVKYEVIKGVEHQRRFGPFPISVTSSRNLHSFFKTPERAARKVG
jgi:hypothetical protein